MAVQKKTKAGRQKEKKFFSFFSDMDPELKSILVKCIGVVAMLVTLFTLVSMLSYLFTWQADKSLFSHPEMMDKSVEVSNMGGKLGYVWSRFLIKDMFGLASFCLVFLMGAYTYRLFFWQRSIGTMRLTFLSVSGTVILAMAFSLFGSATLFDGGLGGDAGSAIMTSMSNLVGPIVPVLVVLVAAMTWLLFASGRFAHWFAVTGEKKPVEAAEPQV